MQCYRLTLMLLSIFYLPFFIQDSVAYSNAHTHRYINLKAIEKSSILENVLKDTIGFPRGKEEKLKDKEVWEWIREGGYEEDDPEWRCLRHFHDPLNSNWDDAGLLSIYKSMVYWAQTPDPETPYDLYNEYSWFLAKDYYYQALMTGSEKQYAKTFRSLGQLMHLISDAAVPAHVRNDPHVPFLLDADPYEKWVEDFFSNSTDEDKALLVSDEFVVDRAIFNMAVACKATPSQISALWDHDEYNHDGSNMPDDLNTTIGLSEYTNANFWTKDSFPWKAFSGDYPHPTIEETNYDEDVWLNPVPEVVEDGLTDNRIYFSKRSDLSETPFLSATYWTQWLYTSDKPEYIHTFTLDEKCFEQYAKKLIPRAIGYSAALLDYFFRGIIELSPPDDLVYSLTDGSTTDQNFEYIKAKLHNTTPNEAMQEGSLVAVARYKRRIDYITDLSSNEPPLESSREETYSYRVSAPVAIQSLTNDPAASEQFTFDFTTDPIPAGITDLSLQIVFKGTLGSEVDTAIAVGMIDLAEPNHISIWSLTDRFYLQETLMTASEIKEDLGLLDYIDNNCTHLRTHIDPFPMGTDIGFSAATEIPPNNTVASYTSLAPGRYGRIIVLTDQSPFVMHIYRDATTPPFSDTTTTTFSAVKNQGGDAGVFDNTAVTNFRGITSHNYSGYLFYCPDTNNLHNAVWPLASDNIAVPAEITFP